MDFLNKLLKRPSPKPAICHRPPTPNESTGEPGAPASNNKPSSPSIPESNSGPSSLARESLSSASSFQSLSSKSSSGICADSAPGSPDKSYVNVDIPDLDDLINACANINLGVKPPSEAQANGEEESPDEASDRSQDATFASAADDTISEETHGQQLEEALQTFKTCPVLDKTQVLPQQETGDSSVHPYVSFEESVLRKHQEKSEEFKSALASFQQSVTGALDEPQQQQQQSSVNSDDECGKAKSDSSPFVGSAFNRINELKLQQSEAAFGSPDVSFKEVTGFDATVLVASDTETDDSILSLKAPVGLNDTVLKSPTHFSTARDLNEKTNALDKTQDVCQETEALNKTQDAVLKESLPATPNLEQENNLNKTQDIAQENNFNKTQDIAQENNLNKTQDIAQENNSNKTQDIIQENSLNKSQNIVQEINLNKTQEIAQVNNLNKTQEIPQEIILNKTQDIVQENILNKAEVVAQDNNLNKTQENIIQENNLNKSQSIVQEINLNKTEEIAQVNNLDKTQDIPQIFLNKSEVITQENNLNKSVQEQNIVQENILNKTEINPQENIANKTQDIVQENDFLNKTPNITQEEKVLNKTQDIVQETALNKTQDIVNQNLLNKTQDIKQDNVLVETQGILNETNILNKTQDIAQDKILNKTQDIVQENNNFNKTQEIVQESGLNKTQDIVNKENILNKTQDIVIENTLNNNEEKIQISNKNQSITQEINANSALTNEGDNLNETQLILQKAKQHLNEVDTLAKQEQTEKSENLNPEPVFDSDKELKEQKNKILIQEAKSPLKGDVSVQNRIKTPDKTELVTEKPVSEEIKPSDNFDLVASTPFEKSLNKESPTKPSKRRSALFSKDAQQTNPESVFVSLEDNRTELESTIAINNSLEPTKEAHDNSLNLLPAPESEYTAFKPQQQSTTLPVADLFDFQEAALSVAKDIDASLEHIEDTEKFVSAHELFGDPAAFDFLNQVGSKTTKRGERFDSLFMKFDPLAQRLSMLPQKNLPPTPPVDEEEDSVKEGKSAAPTAVANPTPPSIANTMNTPKKNPALAAIDRLLFYSPSVTDSAQSDQVAEAKQKKEVVEKQEPVPQTPLIDEKMAKELELVRSTVLQLEAELEKQKKEQKEALEKQKSIYEKKINSLQAEFSQMQTQLSQEVKCKEQMSVVVEEYEKSISRLIAEREKDRTSFEAERAKLQEDLQVANQHLSNTEAAFSDVHSKYERMKNICSAYKTNEGVLKESIAENQETIKTLENRYEQLKSHAMAQLEKANLELSAIRKQNDAENVKLKALVRKAELKSKSLEETVEQKMHENKELTKIIDEMIARVE